MPNDASLTQSHAEKTPQKAKLRMIRGFVANAIQETPDTWTLNIFVDPANKDYAAGQFISIDPHQFPELKALTAYLEHKKGKKELVRAYSMGSAPHEPYVSITIKPEGFDLAHDDFPPLLSPLLASNALVGREIDFLGYTGSYTLKPDHDQVTTQILHFVAGSGAVPNYALLKDELIGNKHPSVKHTMINVNKYYEDIIYCRELEELARIYRHRFELIHLLTREGEPEKYGPNFKKGRPTLDFVKQYVDDPATVLVYACGAAITKWQRKKAEEEGKEPTPRFLETVSEIMQGLGVDRKRYKKEIYG